MDRMFKALSLLLSYPGEEFQRAIPELEAALVSDIRLPANIRGKLATFLREFATGDLYDLQERYVLLFDRTRSLSLHLFEHVHGEGRDRGQALVALLALYDEHGLVAPANELPDFLPLYLEFLAVLPEEEARRRAAEPLHVISALRERLEKRESAYAAVLLAIEAFAEGTPDRAMLDALRAVPDDDPNDLAALDRAWAEEPVTFGPGEANGSCTRADAMLRRMGTPAAARVMP